MTEDSNSYTKVLKLIDHYKAIGTTEYELSQTDDDLPWDKVVRFTYINMDNFIFFTEPIEGIEFCWEIYVGWEDRKIKSTCYQELMGKLKNKPKIKKQLISKINSSVNQDIKFFKTKVKEYTSNLNWCLKLKETYTVYNKK